MDLPDTPPDSKFNSRFRRFTALLGLEPVLDGRSRGALPDPNPDDAHIARDHKGPEMPCLRIIKKCMSMNTASNQGITNV